MPNPTLRHLATLAAAALCGCAGNGQGLDASGQPAAPGSAAAVSLTAEFQSIQDNILTPICVRCHSGAGAPEGLQLDAAHSYALLVGVPSTEVPGVKRVQPNDPDSSYLVEKLAGAAGIVGQRMPFGGPYLPQSSIDVVRQWITNGAQRGAVPAAAGGAAFALTATSPPHQAVTRAAPRQLLIAFNHEVDFSLVNETTVYLEQLKPEGPLLLPGHPGFQLAQGNPAAVLITPAAPLAPADYRLTVRGRGAAALADVGGQRLDADVVSEFTVKDPLP